MNTIIKNHKKGVVILVTLIVVSIFATLAIPEVWDLTNAVTIEESQQHFEEYISEIDKYMSSVYTPSDKKFEKGVVKTFSDGSKHFAYSIKYTFENGSHILISLYNDNDTEQYSLWYTSGCDTACGNDTNIDSTAICNVLNIVSGKKISEEELQDFLLQRNGKYERELLNEETVRNGKNFGFFEHWKMDYFREPNKFKATYGDVPFLEEFKIVGLTNYGTEQH